MPGIALLTLSSLPVISFRMLTVRSEGKAASTSHVACSLALGDVEGLIELVSFILERGLREIVNRRWVGRKSGRDC